MDTNNTNNLPEINSPQSENIQEQHNLDENKLSIFKQTVKQWLDIDNEIRALETALKERKKNRKEIQENIMVFMGEYNIKNMNTDDGKLTYNESKTKKPLNKDFIKTSLSTYFNNSEDGEKITEYLCDHYNSLFRREEIPEGTADAGTGVGERRGPMYGYTSYNITCCKCSNYTY